MTRGEHGSGSVTERQASQREEVNGALPAIQREVGGSVGGLQWVIDAYPLALAAVT